MKNTYTYSFSDVTRLPHRLLKQAISTVLFVYVSMNLDFGLIIKPLETNNTLLLSNISLLAGLLALFFLAYSLLIQLKEYTEPQPEPVKHQSSNMASIEMNKNYTGTVYFGMGCSCFLLFILI